MFCRNCCCSKTFLGQLRKSVQTTKMNDSFEDDDEWKPPTEGEMKVLEARRERSNRISALMGEYLLKGYKMLGTTCPDCGNILMKDRQLVDYCVACQELACDVSKDDPALDPRAMQRTAAEQPRISGMDDDDDHADSIPVPTQHPNGSCVAMIASACGASQSEAASHDFPPDAPSDSGQAEAGLTAMPLLRSYGGLPTSIWSSADHRRPIKPEPTNRLKVGSTFPEVASAFSGWKPQQSQGLSGVVEAVQSKLVWAGEQLQRTSNVTSSTQLCELMKACAETLAALQKMQ